MTPLTPTRARSSAAALTLAAALSLACGPRVEPPVGCAAIAALPSTAAIQLTRVFHNVDVEGGVVLTQRPDDDSRWYLATQGGVVYSFANEQDAVPSVFIDVTDQLATAPEAGLLGLAFHPDFATNGYVYLSLTTPGAGAFISRIARYHSDDGGLSLDPASEAVIFDLTQPYTNHNGGDIHFGHDGLLYIGFGDGGSKEDPNGHGQNTDTLLGSMLRIDVDGADPYAIPADNPFASGGGAPEIFAWGLRNPWRFSFDRETGDLWAGDVGQYDWEEVDRIRLGGNYGWNLKEGAHCFAADPCDQADLVDPVAAYANPDDASVVGGYVYRGAAMPELVGSYIYTDFYLGTIWAVVEGAEPSVLLGSSGHAFGAFGEDQDGELYGVDYGGGIWRLAPNVNAGAASELPTSLRATGCVDADDPTQPPATALGYELNVPFWSDGADKARWLHLAEGETITVEADGDWSLPPGSVVVKLFRLGDRPVETRLLVHHDDGRWAGYSYAWNQDGSDAELLRDGELRSFGSEQWLFPSRAECMSCHTSAAGISLGLETGQLQRGTQLQDLVGRGWLAELPTGDALPSIDGDAALEDRARAYLHANCSHCHRAAGPSNTPGNYRYDRYLVDPAEIGVCDVEPVAGDLGVPGARILVPGDPASSVLSLRLHADGDDRMPQLGSLAHDDAGIALIDEWITALVACP
ncbi:PQQ-dependent sugar dehydrogenase [Enhygromyxa salina]|uniref:Quinoprotein glucose dehydrogenase B n=1 Tax=Enhygromyxa salina TaxID=215803 RepID=A0A2S9Y835_9BACT|nr:PQQ-dependent sugar dehydrogenase [Enhygromyxa salina]PRQ01181.1 Quinoprotein glucose dehydrogenase B precursor [Enhygromyxa salina]